MSVRKSTVESMIGDISTPEVNGSITSVGRLRLCNIIGKTWVNTQSELLNYSPVTECELSGICVSSSAWYPCLIRFKSGSVSGYRINGTSLVTMSATETATMYIHGTFTE